MIRAFAVALAVGTIRVWVGIFQLLGLLAIQDGTGIQWFGIAFWLAFASYALAAEVYVLARPTAAGRPARRARPDVVRGTPSPEVLP
jgi:hypothetical protein